MDEDYVFFYFFFVSLFLFFHVGVNEPPPEKGVFWGVLGGKPWFYTFWGF
jgi:hypothetical protein